MPSPAPLLPLLPPEMSAAIPLAMLGARTYSLPPFVDVVADTVGVAVADVVDPVVAESGAALLFRNLKRSSWLSSRLTAPVAPTPPPDAALLLPVKTLLLREVNVFVVVVVVDVDAVAGFDVVYVTDDDDDDVDDDGLFTAAVKRSVARTADGDRATRLPGDEAAAAAAAAADDDDEDDDVDGSTASEVAGARSVVSLSA